MRLRWLENSPRILSSISLPLWLALAGCGGGENPVKNLQQSIQKTVSDAQTVVVETVAQSTGKILISFPQPIDLTSAYAWVIPAGENRPAVLQIANYLEAEVEKTKPPLVFFQADLPPGKMEELVGKKIAGRLFVQYSEDSLYASNWALPAEFEITSANSWSVGCKAVQLPLQAAGETKELIVDCELLGVLQTLAGTGVAPQIQPAGNAAAAPTPAAASTPE